MAGGRPTKYKPDYVAQAAKLCALGATDAEMADFFEVTLSTFSLWKVKYAEFSDSLKSGKDIADRRVETALYNRAMGYSHEDTDIRVIEGQVVMTPMIKNYPPDTTAAIFWLKNRQPEQWRDKREIGHSGVIDLSGKTDDELNREIAAALAGESGSNLDSAV
jgi:hypothetical protein